MNKAENNFNGCISDYLSKKYIVKFWKFFTLEVFSEDRGDGTYKHFVTVYFGKKRLVNITYRTGFTGEMYDNSPLENHYQKEFYMGTVSKGFGEKYAIYSFADGKVEEKRTDEDATNTEIVSKQKDIEMSLYVSFSAAVRKVREYYFSTTPVPPSAYFKF